MNKEYLCFYSLTKIMEKSSILLILNHTSGNHRNRVQGLHPSLDVPGVELCLGSP